MFTATTELVNRLSPAPRGVGVGRRRVAGAEDIETRFRIVGAGHPGMTAAVARGVEVLPRLEPRIAGIHRHAVELPLHIAGVRVERQQVARRVEVVAGADDHVVLDDGRRRRQKYCWLKLAISLCQRSSPVRASSETR